MGASAVEIVARCKNAAVTVEMVASILPSDRFANHANYALGAIQWLASDDAATWPPEVRLARIAAGALAGTLTAEERVTILEAREAVR